MTTQNIDFPHGREPEKSTITILLIITSKHHICCDHNFSFLCRLSFHGQRYAKIYLRLYHTIFALLSDIYVVISRLLTSNSEYNVRVA